MADALDFFRLVTLSSLLWLTSRAMSLTWSLRAGSEVGWVRELKDMIMLMVTMVLFLIHNNCTIFLFSLDVRNIVQGGDPLYAGFFSTQGSGGYT